MFKEIGIKIDNLFLGIDSLFLSKSDKKIEELKKVDKTERIKKIKIISGNTIPKDREALKEFLNYISYDGNETGLVDNVINNKYFSINFNGKIVSKIGYVEKWGYVNLIFISGDETHHYINFLRLKIESGKIFIYGKFSTNLKYFDEDFIELIKNVLLSYKGNQLLPEISDFTKNLDMLKFDQQVVNKKIKNKISLESTI